MPAAPRAGQRPRPPSSQAGRVNWQSAQGRATAPRGQPLTSTQALRDALFAPDCSLTLLQCAIWFKKMPNRDLPSAADLRRLGTQFAFIKANTPPGQLDHPATLGQWSNLFAKCGRSQEHQAALLPLLKETAAWLQLDSVKLNAQGIGNILYNLQKLAPSEGTEAVLLAIADHIENAEQLDPQAIGNALYGLQNMASSQATEAVLLAIKDHIENAQQLKPQEIGNALYGLQNMASSQATEAVLLPIADHIENAEQLKPQEIGNALYGLQNMVSSQATEAVLLAIKDHIENAEQLNPQNIGNALYGLQNMASSQATEAVLLATADHIENAGQLSPQAIGNALYGLQNMASSQATEAALLAIKDHIENAEQLSPQNIGNALYGLQNMASSQATEAVLLALKDHIENAQQLDPQAIGNALYGLQNMSSSEGVKALLSALNRHVKQLNVDSRSSSFPRHFLAETIHSLTPYFSGESAECAESLLSTLAERLHIPLPTATLADAASRQQAICQLLKDAGNIHPSVCHPKVTEIDLHGLSHALAAAFCQTALRSLLKDGVSPIDIIYGKSSHKASNEGKMRARVESVLAGSEFSNLSRDFGEAYVRVTRAASSADKGSTPKKAGLNPNAQPFIPGARRW